MGPELALSCYLPYSIKDRLLLTVWTLATRESYRQVGNRFGTSRGEAIECLKGETVVLMYLTSGNAKKSTNFITWPHKEMYDSVASKFTFPDTLGTLF